MGKSSTKNKSGRLRKIIFASVILVAVVLFFSMAFAAYNARETFSADLRMNEDGEQSAPEATPTITEQITEEPSPTMRAAFIPDPDDLLPLPEINDITVDSKLVGEIEDEQLNIYWEVVDNADYYVFCAMNDKDKIYHKEILWPDISEWLLNDVSNGNVYLFCYEDMGEDSADDDKLIATLALNIDIATATPEPESTPKPSGDDEDEVLNKYMIIVDKADLTFAAFTYDENGEYAILVKAFPTAIGRSDRTTPVGTFKISSKGSWKTWGSGSYSPYYTRFTSGLYFHGAIYSRKSGNSLYRASYEQVGSAASSGCLRTTYEAAHWVYYNCPAGTQVKIVNSSDLVPKIYRPDIDPAYPTWDPTDPNKPSLDPPAVITNSVLNVNEGQSGNLEELLSAYDANTEASGLIYEVVTQPENGALSSSKFTQEELDNGEITYTHDGSDTESDSFQFTVTNLSAATGTITFNINVTLLDDTLPVITINEWITIDQGDSHSLSTCLRAEDDETPSSELVYTITTMPEHGTITGTFTQTELLDGEVVYIHDGGTADTDSFIFSVSDGENVLTDQMFTISIDIPQPETTPDDTPEPTPENTPETTPETS